MWYTYHYWDTYHTSKAVWVPLVWQISTCELNMHFYKMFHKRVKFAACLHIKLAVTCSYGDMWQNYSICAYNMLSVGICTMTQIYLHVYLHNISEYCTSDHSFWHNFLICSRKSGAIRQSLSQTKTRGAVQKTRNLH